MMVTLVVDSKVILALRFVVRSFALQFQCAGAVARPITVADDGVPVAPTVAENENVEACVGAVGLVPKPLVSVGAIEYPISAPPMLISLDVAAATVVVPLEVPIKILLLPVVNVPTATLDPMIVLFEPVDRTNPAVCPTIVLAPPVMFMPA